MIGFRQRFNAFPDVKPLKESTGKNVWIHAASVGEVKVAKALIGGILHRFPQSKIVLSTFTDTGLREAEKISSIQAASLLPLDLPFLIRPALKKIRANLFLSIESEFWPNLFNELKKTGIPSVLINGRISEKSFHGYQKIGFLLKTVLSNMELACMRNRLDAERIISLGMPGERVVVTGNIKFDFALSELETVDPEPLKKTLQVREGEKSIIFANTRDGEELLLVPMVKNLLNKATLVVIAPRHIERIREIEELLKKERVGSLRWSELGKESARDPKKVVLFDVMGKLFPLYGVCSIAFLGGSLLPFGGQNILEPAVFGKPVFFGPHMKNFEEEARILIESGGAKQVANAEELEAKVMETLRNPEETEKIGLAAKEAVKRESGVLERCLNQLEPFMAP